MDINEYLQNSMREKGNEAARKRKERMDDLLQNVDHEKYDKAKRMHREFLEQRSSESLTLSEEQCRKIIETEPVKVTVRTRQLTFKEELELARSILDRRKS